MPLTPGEKLGPYEIQSLLGKGGMGEVYKAHDPRLRRDVAIKTSATQFSERFDREARAIASLNHTNVCHLYDVGPNYIVMELVEGETLAGAMTFDEALPVIRQLIDGIEAAHEKNIIHRDLKPANIKITHEGVVKILDFGLAKATEVWSAGDPGESPTLTMGATVAGTILGTAAYMSPEQAKGKQVDKRADIFSFGVVVYELLTGKSPFKGETVVESLGAILNKDPDWTPIPARAQRLLRCCLQKDRKSRLASISDARLILDEPVAVAAEPVTIIQKEPASKLPWLAAAAAVFAMAAYTFYPRPAPPVAEAVRFTIAPPEGSTLTPYRSQGAQAVVSPDGRYLVVVAEASDGSTARRLWLRPLGSQTAQQLDQTDGAFDPFWSPDSKNIAFFAEGKLKRIAVSGGSPINVCDAGSPEGGSWSEDGIILLSPGNAGLQRVAASGGVPAPVTNLATGEREHRHPQFLPGGKRFLYVVSGGSKPGLYLQALGSNQRTFLLETGRALAASGYVLYWRDNTVLAQPFDWDALKPVGEPLSVTDDVRGSSNNGRDAFSVSATGVLAYRGGGNLGTNRYRWYSREGKPDATGLELAAYGAVELSPDNKRAVVERATADGTDLWLVEFPGGTLSRLTSDPGAERWPTWSPDSRRIAFDRKDGIHQMLIGSGKATPVYPDLHTIETWSPQGFLVYTGIGTGGPTSRISLFAAPEETAVKPLDPKPRHLIEEKYAMDDVRVSPDGKWVAYLSQESGGPEIWVASFPEFTARRKISTGRGIAPLWRGDGKELIYFGGDDSFMSVEVKTGAGFEAGVPKPLFKPAGASVLSLQQILYAITYDGKRFFVRENPNAGAAEIEPVHVVLNWPALLGK